MFRQRLNELLVEAFIYTRSTMQHL